MKERITGDLTAALKSGDKVRLSVLRMLSALIKNREVEKRGPLTDAEVIQAVASSCKMRREAIEQFRRGGRADLVAKEETELTILEGYLPESLSPEELLEKIRQAIGETHATSLKDMGKVMAHLMPQIAGRCDGKVASQMVRDVLSGS